MILNPKVIYKTMNIKNIIRNQSVRHFLLKLFVWLPDRIMLPFQYWLILRRKLDMKNPKRFTEKIQCYKAFYRNKEMLRCVDKFLVRDYVIEKLGTDKYLNRLYQVCDKAEDIDWESLPDKFVIKTTDGGNGDNVFICRNKSIIDKQSIVKKINSWKGKKLYSISREWAYIGAKESRIIVEEYLSEPNEEDLKDYKFLCFNGKFKYLELHTSRFNGHKRGYWNENLEYLNGYSCTYPPLEEEFNLPHNIQQMIRVAETLSRDFPFARIDLYNINGRIVFGEITFYPSSGYMQYSPDEFDIYLGKEFNINF